MRKQRSGHIISISSSAGLAAGFEFVTAYAASKFGLEGWMESLQAEVAPFGIFTTIVNPGFFRTARRGFELFLSVLNARLRAMRNELQKFSTRTEKHHGVREQVPLKTVSKLCKVASKAPTNTDIYE